MTNRKPLLGLFNGMRFPHKVEQFCSQVSVKRALMSQNSVGSNATTQQNTQASGDDDRLADLSQKLSQVVTPPQKLQRRKRARLSTGMSPSASMTVLSTCKKCGMTFTSGMLARMHRYKRCDSKAQTSLESAVIMNDFAEMANFGDETCQLVCYVLAVQAVIKTGNRRYLLRAVLGDKNGRRCNMIWFFDVDRASKHAGIVSRVGGEKMWEVAAGTLHKALLRAVSISPVRIKKTESKYKNPGNHVAVFNSDSQIIPLDPDGGDFERIRPTMNAWGTPSNPLATIQSNAETMKFESTYYFLGFVCQCNQGEKSWNHTWGTNVMARGTMLVYMGEDESGEVTFRQMSWVAFLQKAPKPRAPW